MGCEGPAGPGFAVLLGAARGRAQMPPVGQWNPPYCGDSDMVIARDGSWSHRGALIRRPELVRLFSTLLRKDDAGYMLVTPAEKLSIRVEDAPFLAVSMMAEGADDDQHLIFTTNVGDLVRAGPDHSLRFQPDPKSGAPIPYLDVRAGLEAKLTRPVYYALVERAVARDGVLGVWSGGAFFAMGQVP